MALRNALKALIDSRRNTIYLSDPHQAKLQEYISIADLQKFIDECEPKTDVDLRMAFNRSLLESPEHATGIIGRNVLKSLRKPGKTVVEITVV